MKKPSSLKAIAALSLLAAPSVFAQSEPVPGSVATMTLNLTVSESVLATVAKDELGKPIKGAEAVEEANWSVTNSKGVTTETTERLEKIVSSKYSTKEFLLDLLDEGVIEDIKGWTIKKVQATYPGEEGITLSDPEFFLQHKDGTIIYLGDTIAFNSDVIIKGENFKKVEASTEEDGVISSKTNYVEALKYVGTMEINLEAESYFLNGVLTGSQKLAFTKAKDPVIQSGAAKITSLAGYIDEEDKIVEGSAALAAGSVSDDVSAFLDTIPEPEL